MGRLTDVSHLPRRLVHTVGSTPNIRQRWDLLESSYQQQSAQFRKRLDVPAFTRRWLWSNLDDAPATVPTSGEMHTPALKDNTGSTFAARMTSRSCFARIVSPPLALPQILVPPQTCRKSEGQSRPRFTSARVASGFGLSCLVRAHSSASTRDLESVAPFATATKHLRDSIRSRSVDLHTGTR